MELLQTITEFYNTEPNLPAQISKCTLLSDNENVRILLRLSLKKPERVKSVCTDICCYGKDGFLLSVMEHISYIDGGMLVKLPSLMTAQVAVILREAELGNGIKWKSGTAVRKQIKPIDSFDKTDRFNSSEVVDTLQKSVKPTRREKRELKKAKAAEEEEIRQMIKSDPRERKKRIAARIIIPVVTAALIFGGAKALMYKNEADTVLKKAMNLYNSGKFEDAISELEKANNYYIFGDDKQELDWALAMSYARGRDFFDAAVNFKKQVGYKESSTNYRSIAEAYSGIVSAGTNHTVALKSTGTVVAAGDSSDGQCDVKEWLDITKVAAGGNHSVGLTRDKKVIATGSNDKKQCNVKDWRNIVDISAGSLHTVGVENTGRVVATGDNTYGQCEIENWSGIVSVCAAEKHTVGLKIDGTVTAAGDNTLGQCNVSAWSDVMQIAAGNSFTAALKYDGTILVTGNINPVPNTDDILFISASNHCLLLTTVSGKVELIAENGFSAPSAAHLRDIAAVSGGALHCVGISTDGKAFGMGDNTYGQTSLDEWTDLGIPKQTVKIMSEAKN